MAGIKPGSQHEECEMSVDAPTATERLCGKTPSSSSWGSCSSQGIWTNSRGEPDLAYGPGSREPDLANANLTPWVQAGTATQGQADRSLTLSEATFSEPCPGKEQLALAYETKSKLYGLQCSRLARVRNPMSMSHCSLAPI